MTQHRIEVGSRLGEYVVMRILRPEISYLAEAAGGRRVVLKALEEDCLLGGQLHPSVHDRLGRVRELAHAKVANLYGVERIDGAVYLVWEYIEGELFESYVAKLDQAMPAEDGQADPATGAESAVSSGRRTLLSLARELALMVEELHALGIVHGALHGGNVIVDHGGQLHLTHISPLLYNDPEDDSAALRELLKRVAQHAGDQGDALMRIIAEHADRPMRALSARLATADAATERVEVRSTRPAWRWRTWLAAIAVIVVGVALGYGLWRWARDHTPQAPAPPEAPPEALEPVAGSDW